MNVDSMRPNWAEVNLSAIEANVAALKRLSRAPHLMAVVKANGYGHGAVQVAQAALAGGADWFGVASVEEGVYLRQHAITAPILVLGYTAPGQVTEALAHDLTLTLWDLELARALHEAASPAKKARVHIKIDTGMSRVGLHPGELTELIRNIRDLTNVEIEGAFTHFAAADEPDNDYTAQQTAEFEAALAELAAAGIRPRIRHAANTAGLMIHPEAHYELVRTGIAMVGLPPAPDVEWPVKLRPALSWKTRITMVKWVEAGAAISYGCTYRTTGREQIATLPVGYADGYARRLSNVGSVLIHGHHCPIVGRVCMDQLMVRIAPEIAAKVGDEAILIGQQGEAEITATDLAEGIGTVNYEVVCAISQRVPRFYHKDGEEPN